MIWRFLYKLGHHLSNGGLCLIFCPHEDYRRAMARREQDPLLRE